MGDQVALRIVGVAFEAFIGALFFVEQAEVVVAVVGDLAGWVDGLGEVAA